MARISDWIKSKKYNGSNPSKYTIYTRDKDYYVSVGLMGNTKKGYYSITDNRTQSSFVFKDYETAKKQAIKYMLQHPKMRKK